MAPTPQIDTDWMEQVLFDLLRIPSPTGRTDVIMQYVGERLEEIGLPFELTRRGAMIGRLDAEATELARAVVVHTDTIGCMVSALKDNGRLEVVPVGTHSSRFAEGARVTISTDDPERWFTGTILPTMASGHAFGDKIDKQPVSWDHVEVRVDEPAHDAGALARLGIQIGDHVALMAYPTLSSSGYLNSRHLDDKGGVAAALAAFKAIIEAGETLPVGAHLLITISEEVGHGASGAITPNIAELLSVDVAIAAPGQASTETGVTVAMQDLHGPFDYHLTRRLHALALEEGIEVHRDVFRYYRSDVAAALEAGAETRAALVGFGVDATHGNERTHIDSITATARLLAAYLRTPLTFRNWDASPTGPLERFPSTAVQPARVEPRWDDEGGDDELPMRHDPVENP
jgi:peptidase M42 family hydrolase